MPYVRKFRLIAAGIAPFSPETAALRAGRLVLEELSHNFATRTSFAFETTLSGRGYARLIKEWQAAGYRVKRRLTRNPAIEAMSDLFDQETSMEKNKPIDVGVASKLGKYSDAVLVESGRRWLYTSGTPGLAADGSLPLDFETQAQLAWEHVKAMLDAAGMDVSDIVKLTQSLIRPTDLEAYRAIRNKHLGDARPASMLTFVNALVMPGMLIEIEVVAAR